MGDPVVRLSADMLSWSSAGKGEIVLTSMVFYDENGIRDVFVPYYGDMASLREIRRWSRMRAAYRRRARRR